MVRKTHTMMGMVTSHEEADGGGTGAGVIPRAIDDVFAHIYAAPSGTEFTVRVSYLEIYLEVRLQAHPSQEV